MLKLLISRRALCDEPDVDGIRPISVALQLQDEAIVQMLIASGVDLTQRTKDGSTLLHSTAWAGHEAMTKLLLDSGEPRPGARYVVMQQAGFGMANSIRGSVNGGVLIAAATHRRLALDWPDLERNFAAAPPRR